MSESRKLLHKSTNSATPASISEAEIIDLINHLPLGGDRWYTAIDAVTQILDAAEAKDIGSLRKLSTRSKGGKLPKRLAGLAVSFLEQDEAFSATIGPDLALKYFFRFSRHYSFARRAWMAENHRRTAEPSIAEPSIDRPTAETERIDPAQLLEPVNHIGETCGPRLQLVALCGVRELITPELATAMLRLAYGALGLPLKQKGGV